MRTKLTFATATAVAALAFSAGPAHAAAVLAKATINNPSISLGNYHRGGVVTPKGISITNTVMGSPQQKLDGSVSGKTGGITITTGGFFTLLAPGATNNVAIKVGIDTTSVGSKSGTVTLKFVSDGTGTTGTNTNLPSQTVAVTGAVFDFANATISNPLIALGNYHVGDAVTPQGVSVANTVLSNAAFQEGLDAVANGSTGGVINQGSISLLGAGHTNNTGITVGIDTSTAGNKSGTASIFLRSDGTGTSNLGNSTIDSQTIKVTGAAYDYAQASVGTPLIFGNHHVGDTVAQQGVSITNSVVSNAAYQEGLNASIAGTSGGATTNGGSINLLAAGNTDSSSIKAGIDTSSAGDKSGTVTLGLVSNGTGTSGLGNTALTSQSVNVYGAAYDYAQATVGSPIAFGNHHVGDVVAQQGVSITNTVVSNAAYQESLDASIAGTSGGVTTNGGSFNLLGAGNTDNSSIKVGIDTSTAGDKSGAVTLGLVSDGTGTSGLGNTPLASKNVNVTGAVYNYASSSSIAPVNFGIHHVGDPAVTQTLPVTNTAPASPYSEGLDSTFGSFSGTGGTMLGASGAISNLAAGATDNTSMALALNTSAAGILNGNITVHQASNGATTSGLGTTALSDQVVAVTGQVNAYAHGSYVQTGGTGTLIGSGANYLIDFGQIKQNAPGMAVDLALINDVLAPADALSGQFTLPSLPSELILSGFSNFSDLAPGATDIGLAAMVDTSHVGFFDVFVTLDLFGSNASGYYAALPTDPTVTLEIRGDVAAKNVGVPEPATLALFGTGLAGFGALRRKRKKA